MISIESTEQILRHLSKRGVPVWVDGGWAVDAVLKEKTREHLDLDLIIEAEWFSSLETALSELDFMITEQESGLGCVFKDGGQRKIDVHIIEFNSEKYGVFRHPDGRVWPLPPSAFEGKGLIGSTTVRCLSVEAQVHTHAQGYTPSESDFQDMEKLQQRFGVVIPFSLVRQEHNADQ